MRTQIHVTFISPTDNITCTVGRVGGNDQVGPDGIRRRKPTEPNCDSIEDQIDLLDV